MGIFDKIMSIFTGRNKVIDMNTINPGSFQFIATDAIESFNKESNCYLKIKKARKRKVKAVDKKYEGYGKFLLTLEDSVVEVAFKSKEMVYHVSTEERMLSDLNDALQHCDVYATGMDYFVVRKMAYVDVNDVEGSKDEMKKSLKDLLEDVQTIIKQSLPWPRTTEYENKDEDEKEKNTQRIVSIPSDSFTSSDSYTSGSSSYSSRSSSSQTQRERDAREKTAQREQREREAKEKADRKASLDRRKNDIKITIESLQRQKAELDRRIKWCQEQNKGIKDKHTKEVNKAQIDQCRKQKENLNNSIERERERLRNL